MKKRSRSAEPKRPVRLNKPERFQAEIRFESLDQRLDIDHLARLVWEFTLGLDLSPLYQAIEAVEGRAGRNATEPRVLFALWLYAAFDGVNNARELDRLCNAHRAYEWLRGGVPINYHMLSDFRVQHGDLLKQLQSDSLAGMLAEGLLTIDTVAQDGMRVRANASAASFRRQPTLEKARQEAKEYLDKLNSDDAESSNAQGNAEGATPAQQAARERAAREKSERINKAVEVVKQLAVQREARKKGDGEKARASTTDPDARKMKMADGGFRPAVNVQMASDTASGIIVAMDVTSEGSDAGQMKPMIDMIEEHTGQRPTTMITDGGFAILSDIEATEAAGTTVYTPVKEEEKQRKAGKDPFAPKPGDSPTIAAWRARMATEAAKALYRLRCQTAELSNARLRNQGVYQMQVRGLAKIKAALYWHVLAVNMLRAHVLRVSKLATESAGSSSE
jgi:transposase